MPLISGGAEVLCQCLFDNGQDSFLGVIAWVVEVLVQGQFDDGGLALFRLVKLVQQAFWQRQGHFDALFVFFRPAYGSFGVFCFGFHG